MAKYTGRIKLVILDIGGTVCDGPQDCLTSAPLGHIEGFS